MSVKEPSQIHRFPQSAHVDAVRWLPPLSAFDRFAAVAEFDFDTCTASLQILSINRSNVLIPTLHSSWTPPSRISSLKISQSRNKPLLAAATSNGGVHMLVGPTLAEELSTEAHNGTVTCVDLIDGGGAQCVSVGEDGKVNLLSVGEDGRLRCWKVWDSHGLESYTASKWASPAEFATGGFGFGLQWWDQRKPGGAVAQFKANWAQGSVAGIVHSIDIHPSRKHTCLAGGSSGALFAWDLRWQQQPIILAGVGTGEAAHCSPSESEVWEVQYDCYTPPPNNRNFSSSRVLPVMFCSEDGILAVVEQGEQVADLMAEPCAINSFDIDKQNPSDVICSLEWESIAIFARD